MPTMRAAEHAAVAHVNGNERAVPRRMEGLVALSAAVASFRDQMAGPQRDEHDEYGGKRDNDIPRHVVALRKPVHLAGGEAKQQ